MRTFELIIHLSNTEKKDLGLGNIHWKQTETFKLVKVKFQEKLEEMKLEGWVFSKETRISFNQNDFHFKMEIISIPELGHYQKLFYQSFGKAYAN